jgi:hypothetical protein
MGCKAIVASSDWPCTAFFRHAPAVLRAGFCVRLCIRLHAGFSRPARSSGAAPWLTELSRHAKLLPQVPVGLGSSKAKLTPAGIVLDDFAGQYLDIGQESGEK